MQMTRFLLAMAVAATTLPAHSIVIRPDRDDAEYAELATRYPSAVALGAPDGGEGVLIAPRWILTSAARAKALQEMKPLPRIRIGEGDHEIQAFFVDDVALILLRKAVRDVEPSKLYRQDDESGKAVVIVGHGNPDRKKRASINTVDRVEARTLGLRVKPLDDASDLQGTATSGDLGGPAFVEVPAGIFVAGILSSIAGDWETYARASSYVPWIEAVMLDVAKREMDSMMDPDRQ
jgi:hypothetical protein